MSFIIICSEAHLVIRSFIQQTFTKHHLPARHYSKYMDGPVMSQESRSPAFSKLHISPSHPYKCRQAGTGSRGAGVWGRQQRKPSRITFAKYNVTSQGHVDPQRAGMGTQCSSRGDWASNAQGRGGGVHDPEQVIGPLKASTSTSRKNTTNVGCRERLKVLVITRVPGTVAPAGTQSWLRKC